MRSDRKKIVHAARSERERAEELSVIERFLAERGATHCDARPADAAPPTFIQQANVANPDETGEAAAHSSDDERAKNAVTNAHTAQSLLTDAFDCTIREKVAEHAPEITDRAHILRILHMHDVRGARGGQLSRSALDRALDSIRETAPA